MLNFRDFDENDRYAFCGAESNKATGECPRIAEIGFRNDPRLDRYEPCVVVGFCPDTGRWVAEFVGVDPDGLQAQEYVPGAFRTRRAAEVAAEAALLNEEFLDEFASSAR